jgi:5-methyltetrahydropteroyltriglutamate--homocysteine methyltransferase
MQRTRPPFRADHVGSLLRPAPLKEARTRREKGEISAAQLKEVEDREIEKIVRKQEEIGLKLVTDGEFRRSWWQFDFYRGLDGVELYATQQGIAFAGVATKAESVRVVGKVGFSGHAHLDHFRFLKDHARVTPKMTIPAPSTLHFRQGRQSISKEFYPDLDAYFHDVGLAYQKAIRAFYDAGCRYLQLDDTAWSMICDPKERAASKQRGDDPDRLPAQYARMTNLALAGRPADMAVTMLPAAATSARPLSPRAATSSSPSICSASSTSTATFSSTTPTVPAASSRCGSCPRAASRWCSGSSPRRAASSRRKTTSSGASTKPRNTSPSTSCACRRSAVLPRPRRATSLPRTSSGPSSP